ncbi:MAG: prepilin-type N-terminal cleavage/methylation domain-containing protein [Lysobacteraceae bacterium]|nr:MAG: prepilin-type N-terminal cleavage/methylation domain-containing protein [Xanthomonadaceae bacterium]
MHPTPAQRAIRRGSPGLRGRSGFSMVELMVTVAVMAVLMAAAFPSFTGLVNGNRLTGNANELLASLQMARSEAIRRNARVAVCRTEDQATCADSAGLWTGWLTIVEGTGEVLRVNAVMAPLQMQASETISDDDDRVVFRPDGRARSAAGLLLVASIATCHETSRPAENVRIVSIQSGSRIQVVPGNEGGECPAPGDTP